VEPTGFNLIIIEEQETQTARPVDRHTHDWLSDLDLAMLR
jgi:hypothetical protein